MCLEHILVDKKDIDKMEDLRVYSIDIENKKSGRPIIQVFICKFM